MAITPIKGSGSTNRGDSGVDLAKNVGERLGWFLDGDTVVDKNGNLIAEDLAMTSLAMHRLGWIDIKDGSISWEKFTTEWKHDPIAMLKTEISSI